MTSVAGLQNWTVPNAMVFISETKAITVSARQRAADLKSGMDIFNLPQPSHKELGATEKVVLYGMISIQTATRIAGGCSWHSGKLA